MSRPEARDLVVVDASCRASKLAVRTAPRVRVTFDGSGEVTTHREGIPPTGTEDGKDYANVSVTVTIRGRVDDEG